MSYVIIQGRGLTGLGRVPGFGRLGGAASGIRGERDGLGPHFFGPDGTDGGMFREFARARVGGLGGIVGTVAAASMARAAMFELSALATAQRATTANASDDNVLFQVQHFAQVVGPAALDKAVTLDDAAAAAKIASLQASTRSMLNSSVSSGQILLNLLNGSAIQRFLGTDIEQSVADLTVPDLSQLPSLIPWWVPVLAGAAVIGLIATR